MKPPALKLKPAADTKDLEAVTRSAIKRDAEIAEREAMNCEQCKGLDNCRNSMRGYCYVVREYPDRTRLPYLVVRKCEKNGG